MERADALLSGVGLEVAEDHLFDEQPRPRRPSRRRLRRLRWGGLHRKCSSKRGKARQERRPPSPLSDEVEATRSAADARPTLRRPLSLGVRGGEDQGTGGPVCWLGFPVCVGKAEVAARESGFGDLGEILGGKLKRCEGYGHALRNSNGRVGPRNNGGDIIIWSGPVFLAKLG